MRLLGSLPSQQSWDGLIGHRHDDTFQSAAVYWRFPRLGDRHGRESPGAGNPIGKANTEMSSFLHMRELTVGFAGKLWKQGTSLMLLISNLSVNSRLLPVVETTSARPTPLVKSLLHGS